MAHQSPNNNNRGSTLTNYLKEKSPRATPQNASQHTFTIADFEIIKKLGSGGFGTVFLVKVISDNVSKALGLPPLAQNFAAMKKIEFCESSQLDKQKVQAEAALLQRLRHANIIKYYTSFSEHLEDRSYFCIIMEYAEEGDLSRIIKKARSTATSSSNA